MVASTVGSLVASRVAMSTEQMAASKVASLANVKVVLMAVKTAV